MYSEETINNLIQRIGFGEPQEDGFGLAIDQANSIGTSKRVFKSFHQLVTVENIQASIENIGADDAEFNDILLQIKSDAVREILPLIMDKSDDYDVSKDYSTIIDDSIVLFDDAIGYKVAMSVLEMFVSTKRRNLPERNAKLAINNLKLELNGYRNDSGNLVARGLTHELNDAIKTARRKIFPFIIEVKDASNNW